jgi:hypothetical protein
VIAMNKKLSLLFIAAGAALALCACAPVQVLVDNPKDGSTISVAPDQPLRVRLTNGKAGESAWSYSAPGMKAVKEIGHSVKPAEAGALQLDYFDVVGAAPGQDKLTFTRMPEGGAAPVETFTVQVAVK